MKTIYLHIGNFKTGTSAIQQFCSDNRELLLTHGLDYPEAARPENNPTNHGKLSLSLLSNFNIKIPEWYSDQDSFEDVKASVQEAIEHSHCSKILFSSEEFYRFPRLDEDSSRTVISELQDLFPACEVRVLMYVRSPFDFMKSWYNQLNKAPAPRKRFTDVFFGLDDSMFIPQRNAEFWRRCFGSHSLVSAAYIGETSEHLTGFFQLLGLDTLPQEKFPEEIVNIKRPEADLESDRLRKIFALTDSQKQRKYLVSEVLQDIETFRLLEEKVALVNEKFGEFCRLEGLEIPSQDFSVADLLIHEESINAKDAILARDLFTPEKPPEDNPEDNLGDTEQLTLPFRIWNKVARRRTPR